MRGFRAGLTVQLWHFRSQPDMWIPLLTAPLYTLIFTMIIRHAGRDDLGSTALVAPFFMTMWWLVLFHGGLIIQTERWNATIEMHAAAPTGFAFVLLGRLTGIILIGLVATAEIWLFGTVVLGLDVSIHHPVLLAATVAATSFAMAGTALLFAGLFVLSRSALTYTNSASYPFYVLGGIIAPVALLPGWIQPVSAVVFLSWSAELMRSVFEPGPPTGVGTGLGMIAGLGVATLVVAVVVLARVLHRVRRTGGLDVA